jgi:hypothetical protein
MSGREGGGEACRNYLGPEVRKGAWRSNILYMFLSFSLVSLFVDLQINPVGRDSSVGITTRYGLDGPGIESRWGRGFPHPSRPALGTTKPPTQWVPCLTLGIKRSGLVVDRPPLLASMLKKYYSFTSTSPLSLLGLF